MSVKVASAMLMIAVIMWYMDMIPAHRVRQSGRYHDDALRYEEYEDEEDSKDNASGEIRVRRRRDAHEIPCLINLDSYVSCRKSDSGEIFMPWSYIEKQFEVTGREEENGTFSFKISYAGTSPLAAEYKPGSPFMNFADFNVGYRQRVKLITGTEGVPLTTQWNPKGYHYPIQVAQFGLAHHAKYKKLGEPTKIVLEDGEGEAPTGWVIPKKDTTASVKLTQDLQTKMNVLDFKTFDGLTKSGIYKQAPNNNMTAIAVDLKFVTNGSISVLVKTNGGYTIRIHYLLIDELITTDEDVSEIFYGLGAFRQGKWFHIARNLQLDLEKGVKLRLTDPRQISHEFALSRILEVRLHGTGMLDNLALQSHVHKDQFFDTADWFVKHQDAKGGWPIPTKRKLDGVADLLPGWYSAMGQGQALSVLARAYFMTGHRPYMEVAAKGLLPYDVDSSQGGVRAVFFNKYVWYEEYPTTPSSFVLNGFIYALLGVYDLKEVADGMIKMNAERIYTAGLTSLKAMVNMYDSGVGTIYDLRHIITGIEPNRARWDYHTTHIELLLQMQIIDGDPVFKSTCDRWMRYLKGIKSGHN